MKTFLAFVSAFWLVALRHLLVGGLVDPWSAADPSLAFIILLAIVADVQTSLRFAAFVGLFTMLFLPAQGIGVFPIAVLVSLAVGPLYRLLFTVPTVWPLTTAAMFGSFLSETGLFLSRLGYWYEFGFPDTRRLFTQMAFRFGVTLLLLLISGEVYRRLFLRFRQAFVGSRSIV